MDVAAQGLALAGKALTAFYEAGRQVAPLIVKESVRLVDQVERLADSAERAVAHYEKGSE